MAKSANELRSLAPRVSGIGFRQQLVLVFTVGIGSLALASSLTISSLSNALLRDHIIALGKHATQTLAARSTLALLYRSPESAKEATAAIMAFPGVRGVGVFDPVHEPLLTKGVASLPPEGPAQWPKRLHLDHATKEHWYFVAPVRVQASSRDDHYSSPLASSPHAADLLGYVRVVMGTEDIRSLAGKILGTNLGVSFTFASLLLFVLLAITARLTAPLKSLADLMKRAETGEMHVRAKVQGTKDVVEMGNAFNTLMTVLEAREHQLEKARGTACLRNGHDPSGRQTFEATVPEETPRVLIVDDDRGLRQTLRHVLTEHGYQVEEADNGVKALAFCKRQLPDLILMDAVMPVMDGFTTCGHIRELPGGLEIPILIITALDDDHAVEKAFSSGASDYIGKPVHFSVLRQRVARLLDACYAEKRARQLAYRDGLTLLPNRHMFHDRLEAVIKGPRENQHVHALLFLDLDRFKLVNDALGHEIGDLLLKAVGERIQGCVRGGNSVARIGEDEFSVILENIGSAEIAAQVAEKIRKAVASPFSFLGQQVYVGGSIGIAIFPNDAQDDRTLIKQADMALSRAKALGRDRYCFYETGIGASVSKRLEMESELRRALERDEITLFYQPQVDLKSGRITGMEALVRWQHPERGVISPVHFIPLAEESGLIVPMGEWVMRRACEQAKAWIDIGISKPVAVNVSARQFDHLEDSVARVLDETGLDPHFLELELTESSVMQDPKEMVTKLRCLKEIGVQISIDDFGTGYSSLSYLKHFPFDKLKIDRSFINNVTVDPDDAAIAVTIISMAHSLKLKAIAEGVETEGQLLYLARQGCDEIQGYYFCKPLCKDAATQLLEKDTRLIFNKFTKPNRQTVLIVDDDPVVLALLSRLLEQDNREVLSANSARAGLELLATHHVQVVVSDQVMPEMDGIEFLSRVKELHPETVRIILTGHAEPETITKAVNKGWIYKFMSKPWDDEDLRAQVKEAFAHHHRSSKKKPFIRHAS